MRIELGLFALTAVAALAGCPGTLDDKELFLNAAGASGSASTAGAAGTGTAGVATAGGGPDAGDACSDTFERIIVPTCGGTGCHGATASQQNLDLVSPGVEARIVGVTGTSCAVTLADPANPEGSLMYQKLLAKPPCGAQMPLARPPLSDEDTECIRVWLGRL